MAAPKPLRQSTAGQVLIFGPALDANGAVNTTLSIANTGIFIRKGGATSFVGKNSGGATHIANGVYYATFDATDSNTLGAGEIFIFPSGVLPLRADFVVLTANNFDASIPGNNTLQVTLSDPTAVANAVWDVLPSGAIVDDASNSATTFKTDLTESVNDFWKDAFIQLTSGALDGQVKLVTGYNGTTKFITVEGGFTAEPASGVTFVLVNR